MSPSRRTAAVSSSREAAERGTEQAPVACFGGRAGHPPLLLRAHREEVVRRAQRNEPGGLRAVLDRFVPQPVPVWDAFVLEDMDTPADYARLMDRWFAGQPMLG